MNLQREQDEFIDKWLDKHADPEEYDEMSDDLQKLLARATTDGRREGAITAANEILKEHDERFQNQPVMPRTNPLYDDLRGAVNRWTQRGAIDKLAEYHKELKELSND